MGTDNLIRLNWSDRIRLEKGKLAFKQLNTPHSYRAELLKAKELN